MYMSNAVRLIWEEKHEEAKIWRDEKKAKRKL